MINDLIMAFTRSISSGLLLHEIIHGVIVLPIVLFLYHKTKSLKYSLIPLAIAYLLDMDHWLDYFMYYGARINLTDFTSGEYFVITNRAIVPFHAWEWLLLLAILSYHKKKWSGVAIGLALGLLAHLVWDSYSVGSVIFYSIIYRMYYGFVIPI